MPEDDLRAHLEHLENRLDDYHERLTDAIKQRDELALDAAWGISRALVMALAKITPLVAAALVGFLVHKTIGSMLLASVVAIVVFLIADWIGEKRTWKHLSADRQADRDAMEGLPEWKSEAEKLR